MLRRNFLKLTLAQLVLFLSGCKEETPSTEVPTVTGGTSPDSAVVGVGVAGRAVCGKR